MSAPLNNNDLSHTFSDGTRFRYNRALSIFFAAFRDCGLWVYNASLSLLRIFMPDSSLVLSYDALGHHYLTQLCSGADFTITLNGTTIVVTSTGQVNIMSSQGIALTAQSGNIVLTASQGISLTAQDGDLALTTSADIPISTQTLNESLNNIQQTNNQHTHGGVTSGSANTQPPNQQWT